MKILELRNICVKRIWKRIFADVSLDIDLNFTQNIALIGNKDIDLLLLVAANLIKFKGTRVAKAKIGIGLYPNVIDLVPTMTVKENFLFIAKGLGVKNIGETTLAIIPKHILNRKCKDLSEFESSIVSLHVALLTNPKIVLLSRPTQNIVQKEAFWKYANALLKDKILIFTTNDIAHINNAKSLFFYGGSLHAK